MNAKPSGTRREQVFRLCNDIVASAMVTGQRNVRPTVTLLRQHGLVGFNQNQVQDDIHAWFADVFRDHLEADQIPGLPAGIVSAMKSIWSTALAEATKSFDAARDALIAREAEAETRVQEALEQGAAATRQLESANASLLELRNQVAQLRGEVAAREQRIQAQQEAAVLAAQEHSAAIADIRQEVTQQLHALTLQVQEAKDAREFAMQQLDAERQKTKALEARVDDLYASVDGERIRANEFQRRAVIEETAKNNANKKVAELEAQIAKLTKEKTVVAAPGKRIRRSPARPGGPRHG